MRVIKAIDNFPTTRIRILITTGLIVGTVVTWLRHACEVRGANLQCIGWEPSPNMLVFLASLAGVDLAQYFSRGVIDAKKIKAEATAEAVVIDAKTDALKAETDALKEEKINGDGVTVTTDVSEHNNLDKG